MVSITYEQMHAMIDQGCKAFDYAWEHYEALNRRHFLVFEIVHTAVSSGSWCGGQRQQCGDSGSGLR